MKNSMTSSGIEPATFWFVAQYLNHCDTAVPGKAISITYSVCMFVAWGIKNVMHYIIICALSVSTIFSALSNKRHDSRKTVNLICAFWFFIQVSSEIFLILREIQRVIIVNVHRSSCSGVPRNFVRGEEGQIWLRTKDRENGDLGAVAPRHGFWRQL
jgi:hypothetical protein